MRAMWVENGQSMNVALITHTTKGRTHARCVAESLARIWHIVSKMVESTVRKE